MHNLSDIPDAEGNSEDKLKELVSRYCENDKVVKLLKR